MEESQMALHDPDLQRAFAANRLAIARALEDEPCPYCEGRGTVPPAGNGPYWDRERVLCVECDGTGEA